MEDSTVKDPRPAVEDFPAADTPRQTDASSEDVVSAAERTVETTENTITVTIDCKPLEPHENVLEPREDATVSELYALVKELSYVKTLLQNGHLTDLVPAALQIAGEVEKLSATVKGAEKLRLLQNVLRLAVTKSSLSDEVKKGLLEANSTIVPFALDAAIRVSKGQDFLKSGVDLLVTTGCCGLVAKKDK